MPTDITVIYPADADLKFDMTYYLTTHMPLVLEKFKENGMTSYSVLQFDSTPDGSPLPYAVQATLHFPTVNEAKQAFKSASAPQVIADIPNFTNKKPIIMIGDKVAGDQSR